MTGTPYLERFTTGMWTRSIFVLVAALIGLTAPAQAQLVLQNDIVDRVVAIVGDSADLEGPWVVQEAVCHRPTPCRPHAIGSKVQVCECAILCHRRPLGAECLLVGYCNLTLLSIRVYRYIRV